MSCGRPHETDCAVVLERLFAFLDGELGDPDVARIRQHLDECAPCLSEHDVDVILKAVLRRSCGHECAPTTLRARIMVTLHTPPPEG